MAVKAQFSKCKNIKEQVESIKDKTDMLNYLINSEDSIEGQSEENATPEEKQQLIDELEREIGNDRDYIGPLAGSTDLSPEFDTRIIVKAFNIDCPNIVNVISKEDLEIFIGKCRRCLDDNSLMDELLPDGTEGLPDHSEYHHRKDIKRCLRFALKAYENIDWENEIMQLYCEWTDINTDINE